MILKECFEYIKYLEKTKKSIEQILGDDGFLMDITKKYKESEKIQLQNEDETILQNKSIFPNIDVVGMIRLLNDISEEYLTICEIVEDIKMNLNYNNLIINEDEICRKLEICRKILDKKPYSESRFEYDYYIDNNVKTPYRYNVDVEYNISFDRKEIRNIIKGLQEKLNKISIQILECLLYKVDFNPKYSVHDTLYDIVDDYIIMGNKIC